ncbi:similar to HEAT SHOCK PROTEIN 81.4 [Actinidia rufa]|uniref:Similar to HEAT SHOCK PROTEIN 81.4 n=1 Tax=Actinidia rufa TaxID=165716 RepID=A0A7J0G2T9_9ERIC|nr:similar to HEAT SHOCK PROTEIN 81.4 [Actinidia rufa]
MQEPQRFEARGTVRRTPLTTLTPSVVMWSSACPRSPFGQECGGLSFPRAWRLRLVGNRTRSSTVTPNGSSTGVYRFDGIRKTTRRGGEGQTLLISVVDFGLNYLAVASDLGKAFEWSSGLASMSLPGGWLCLLPPSWACFGTAFSGGMSLLCLISCSLLGMVIYLIDNTFGFCDLMQYVWESQAGGSFTVTRDTSGEILGKGTKMTLYLKEDQLEYLEERRLKDLIKKQSEFITHPISLWIEKTTEKEISNDVLLVLSLVAFCERGRNFLE